MRYAILSDVHGNLHALDAVLADLQAEKPDRVVFLGDAVGYGAFPNECVARLRAVAEIMLMGNHEYAVLHPEERTVFNPYARQAIEWTDQQLTPENRSFLAQRPLKAQLEAGVCAVHASPHNPLEWLYILQPAQAQVQFRFFEGWLCLFGHTHVPVVYREAQGPEAEVLLLGEGTLRLDPEARYLINPGSVGQPRDQDPRASYLLLDTEARTLEIRRLPYPIEQAQAAILAAGLPSFLAERLAIGY